MTQKKPARTKKKERNLAIIGGAGFLGTRLGDRLDKAGIDYTKYDINTVDSSSGIVYVNVEDKETLHQLTGTSSIINLAAVHRDDIRPVRRYDDVNVQGAKNTCDVARAYNINKIIFTSSVAIYGFAPPDTDETGEANYFNDYGRTKYMAEQVYKAWQAEDSEKRTLVIVRPTVIFGEGNRGNVYNLLERIASSRFVMIGNGKNKKSMAYVENVAAFLEHCLSFGPGLHIYNYIDKPDLDMNTLVLKARNILFGKKRIGLRLPAILGTAIGYIADFLAITLFKNMQISSIRIKKFMGNTQFNSSVNETGFNPPVQIEEGLDRTILYEFVEDNSSKRIFETE